MQPIRLEAGNYLRPGGGRVALFADYQRKPCFRDDGAGGKTQISGGSSSNFIKIAGNGTPGSGRRDQGHFWYKAAMSGTETVTNPSQQQLEEHDYWYDRAHQAYLSLELAVFSCTRQDWQNRLYMSAETRHRVHLPAGILDVIGNSSVGILLRAGQPASTTSRFRYVNHRRYPDWQLPTG